MLNHSSDTFKEIHEENGFGDKMLLGGHMEQMLWRCMESQAAMERYVAAGVLVGEGFGVYLCVCLAVRILFFPILKSVIKSLC